MTARLRCSCSILAMLAAAVPSLGAAESLLLYNGRIYTANERQPVAEAVLSIDGRIAFVGSDADAQGRAPAQVRRIDLNGQTVLPGLTDSHAHLSGIGFRELDFNLEGTASLEELQDRLRKRAASTADSSEGGDARWIIGRGWIESRWSPPRFPTREDLDSVVADRPVVLTRADGHALVANTLALRVAGIDRHSRDPVGGAILRAPNGEPTGMLIDEAMNLLRKHIPARTDADLARALEAGAARSVRLGWTQVQDAGTSWKEVDLLCRLYDEGRIKLRVYASIDGPGADAERVLDEGASAHRCGQRLTVRGIKLYIDGALGSRGAALLRPYSDAPESTGLLVNQPGELYPILVRALQRGIQIQTHAIGDRANRIMLDLYEKAFAAVREAARANPRWRIEHAQILDPADIPRFRKLNVIASMQPSHAIGDLYFAPARLGDERLAGAYAWKSLLGAGAIVVAGSDAPVEQGDPRIEFYAAVTRRALDGFADKNWHTEQRVTRQQALEMLTRWPAYAAFQEDERGSIEVGKRADFTVFSEDIMTIPEPAILKAEVVLTIIDGEIVYSAK